VAEVAREIFLDSLSEDWNFYDFYNKGLPELKDLDIINMLVL